MTNANTPEHILRYQAHQMAVRIKELSPRCNGKDHITVGIVMDDKTISIDLSWDIVADVTVEALTEEIVGIMQERKVN